MVLVVVSQRRRLQSTAASISALVVGHQRIMHSSDQMDPVESVKGERESWGLWALRSIQGADFDQGLCTFNGVHSRLGFLPVIPGPCGLFRASAVTEDVLEEVSHEL